MADFLSPQRHDRVLDFAGQSRQFGQIDPFLVDRSQAVRQDRAADDKLADKVQQHVEAGKFDPDA